MMVLGFNVGDDGARTLTLRLDVGRRLWPRWQYDGQRALVRLHGYDFRASVRATKFTPRELAAIRQSEEVLRYLTPLLFAGLLEQLPGLTPLRWRCGRPVDVAEVVASLRRGAVVS